MKKRSVLIRNDIILAVVAAAISLGIYFLINISASEGRGDDITVIKDGQKIMSFSLSRDGVYEIIDGEYSVEVSDGEAFVKKTECKDKVCESMRISKDGGEIICLPNKIVIRHKQEKETAADLTAG